MKITIKLFFVILLLCIFSPLICSQHLLYGMSVPRTLYFWFLVEVSFVIYLVHTKVYRSDFPNKSSINLSLLIYSFLLVLSSIFSISSTGSFLSSFERIDGTISMAHFAVFLLIFGSIKFSDRQWKAIIMTTLVVACLVSIFGILEMEHSPEGRIQSTLSNPLYVVLYLIFHCYLIIGLIFYLLRNRVKYNSARTYLSIFFCLTLFLLFIYTAIHTRSRIAIIALIIGLIFALFCITLFQKSTRIVVLGLLVFIFLGGILLIKYKNSTWIQSNAALYRITELSISDSSIAARKELWRMSLGGIMEKPLFGWGKESFIYFFTKNYSPSLYDNGFWYDRAHNFVFDKIIESGFFGFGGYLLLILSLFVTLWKKSTEIHLVQKCLITGYVISYLIYNLTVFDSYISWLILFTILAYIQQRNACKRVNLGNYRLLIVFFGVCCTVIIMYNVVIRTIKTEVEWTKAYNSENFMSLLSNYKSAYEHAWIGRYDIGLDFSLQKERVKQANFDDTLKKEYYELAKYLLEDLLKAYPNHPILLSHLGFIQQYAGQLPKAILTYELLQKIAPKRQVNLMDLGIMYTEAKRYDDALKMFEKVYQLDNSYKLPLLYKAYTYSLMGEIVNCRKIIEDVPIELIAENIQFVMNICGNSKDDTFLLQLLAHFPDKSKFKQTTYLAWLRLAANQQNSFEIHDAVYSYGRHFLGLPGKKEMFGTKTDSLEIYRIIQGVTTKQLPPEELSIFFDRFPDR